jgi:hypothetical protein
MHASVVPAASRRVSGVSSVAFRLARPPSGPHELTLRLAAPGPVSGEGLDPLCRHSSDAAASAVLPPPEESGGASEDGPSASFAPGILGAPFTALTHPLTFSLPFYLADALLNPRKGTQ